MYFAHMPLPNYMLDFPPHHIYYDIQVYPRNDAHTMSGSEASGTSGSRINGILSQGTVSVLS